MTLVNIPLTARGLCAVVTIGMLMTSCGPGGVADQVARQQAKQAVYPVLATRFPGVPVEPAADCIIDNASSGEILQLARAGVAGPEAEDIDLIVRVATRQETVTCLLNDGLTPLVISRLG
ncbi:hypothetical protein [Actibacterium sp. 188UL27-1]|uniref:hypothetical protein n=1 Tax=Actibacterium sp. 188UL27-1 TaxID=2786961 RepID=UPI00195DA422|nr:hypothetical protein [Actibacterium sp. 188UL27-1]MBM7066535.1 hypothetical protein [Actibacterium sp. 188UL27-1]